MAEQTPLKATFFAFQKREPGGVLLKAGIAAGVAAFVLVIVFLLAVTVLMGSAMLPLFTANASPESVGPDLFGRLFLIFPLELIFLFGFFICLARMRPLACAG